MCLSKVAKLTFYTVLYTKESGETRQEISKSSHKKEKKRVFSLEELANRHLLVRVLLHHFGHRHLKVLLRHVHATLAQRKHTGLCAHGLAGGVGVTRVRKGKN